MFELRWSIRCLLRDPGFTSVALLTLALGIGGNTAMFSLLNALMLRSLPYPDSERIVRVYRTAPQSRSWPHSVADHLDHRERSQTFEHIAAFSWRGFNLAEPGRPAETVRGIAATADLFPVLGTRPGLGRVFTAEEDQPGATRVAVLSHGFWVSRFAADTNIVGRTLRMDGEPVTVIGVMPAGFDHPLFWGPVDVWRPLAFTAEQRVDRASHGLGALGRLKANATFEQAEADMNGVAFQLAKEYPDTNADEGLRLVPMREAGMDDTGRRVSWMSMGLTLFVLLIACANLANLQLARSLERSRELAIRAALGAPRSRLMRQLLVESLLLAVAGGILGLLLAVGISGFIGDRIWIYDRAGFDIPLDPIVFGFALAVTVLTGLVFGIAPAWMASRADVHEALKSGTRGAGENRAHHRLRHGLIVAETALALVLLAGAGLFVQGLERFSRRNPGWKVDGLVEGHLALPDSKYGLPETQRLFAEQLEERLKTIPGVGKAALAWSLPVWGFSSSSSFVAEGLPEPKPGQSPLASVNGVTADYFEALGMRRNLGRHFNAGDRANTPAVAIINETMARRFWPNENPIGKRVGDPDPTNRNWLEVVGVVGDVDAAANFSEPDTRFQMYRPLSQAPGRFLVAVLRTSGASAAAIDALRKQVGGIDPDQPVYEPGTVRESADRILKNFRLTGMILTSFGGLGLLLAAVGVYGVMSGFVAQRSRELGVRMALGAEMRTVLLLVLGRGLRLAMAGVGLGLLGAIGMARLLTQVAPGLPAQAPLTIGLAACVLTVMALLACWIPARRAARVDPMEALRSE